MQGAGSARYESEAELSTYFTKKTQVFGKPYGQERDSFGNSRKSRRNDQYLIEESTPSELPLSPVFKYHQGAAAKEDQLERIRSYQTGDYTVKGNVVGGALIIDRSKKTRGAAATLTQETIIISPSSQKRIESC